MRTFFSNSLHFLKFYAICSSWIHLEPNVLLAPAALLDMLYLFFSSVFLYFHPVTCHCQINGQKRLTQFGKFFNVPHEGSGPIINPTTKSKFHQPHNRMINSCIEVWLVSDRLVQSMLPPCGLQKTIITLSHITSVHAIHTRAALALSN